MRHLSAVFLVALLIVLPSCKYFKGKKLFGKKVDTMMVWYARQDSIRVSDSIANAQALLLAEENARADSLRKAMEEGQPMESKFKYNIIVGSFITPEYAKRFAADYRQKGYDTRILKMDGSRFELVSAEAYDNFAKAITRLTYFQDNVEFDAWLYIKR
jgi:hypothetical protein